MVMCFNKGVLFEGASSLRERDELSEWGGLSTERGGVILCVSRRVTSGGPCVGGGG